MLERGAAFSPAPLRSHSLVWMRHMIADLNGLIMALHDMHCIIHQHGIILQLQVGVAMWAAVLPLDFQKISPDFLSKKTKTQIKKLSSYLQIPPKLMPKCCIILH